MTSQDFQKCAARPATEKQVSNAYLPAALLLKGVSALEIRVSSYSELLKDPRWQKKRLEILNRDSWKCCQCSRGDKTLHVHHKQYRRGAKPWEYDDSELTTLCEGCHDKRHRVSSRLTELMAHFGAADLEMMLGFVELRWWLLYGGTTSFPLHERADEWGEGWQHGFAAAISGMWGYDTDALLAMGNKDGMVERRSVMGIQQSFSREPRLNGSN